MYFHILAIFLKVSRVFKLFRNFGCDEILKKTLAASKNPLCLKTQPTKLSLIQKLETTPNPS
jgi:hypothetical protein